MTTLEENNNSQMLEEYNNSQILLGAAKHGDVATFRMALQLGINFDLPSYWEGRLRTPLMVACLHQQLEVAKFLLKTKKVFVEYKSSDGKTALECAEEARLPEDIIEGMLLGARSFLIHNYNITPCPYRFHNMPVCPYLHQARGEICRRRDPGLYAYSPVHCESFQRGECRYGAYCGEAHGMKEFVYHPSIFRTKPCIYGTRCWNKDWSCTHAHYGEDKILNTRPPPPPKLPLPSFDPDNLKTAMGHWQICHEQLWPRP